MTGKCLHAWFVSLTFPTCRSLPTFSEIRETVQYKLALVRRACLWRASCSYQTGHSSRETVLLLQSGQCLLGFEPMVLRDLERFSYILFFKKILFDVYGCFADMYICTICAPGTLRGQKVHKIT